MKNIVFALPENEEMATKIGRHLNAEMGEAVIRYFPDDESYIQIISEVKDKCVILVCTLHQPNEKLVPLYFLSQTAKSLGAQYTCLIAPYLAYMRQDKVFKKGEGITSNYFGKLISGFANSLVTIDPHLHRISSLSEVYSIPSKVIHATEAISIWIKENIGNALLIGPDSESEQWVSEVAKKAGVPFIILEKVRHGDNDVEVSIPRLEDYKNHTPVLVDDIISTARTMIETVNHLKKGGMKPPICVGIHAVFSGDAYQQLLDTGVSEIVTCNTIPHQSNGIDVSKIISINIRNLTKHLSAI